MDARRSRSTAAACPGSAVTAPTRPDPRAGGDAARPRPDARAGGDAARPRPDARAGGDAARPRPDARAGGDAARPRPDARAGGDAARPRPDARAGGDAARPGGTVGMEAPRPEGTQRGGAAGAHRRQHQVHNEAGSYPDLWLPVGLGTLGCSPNPHDRHHHPWRHREPCVVAAKELGLRAQLLLEGNLAGLGSCDTDRFISPDSWVFLKLFCSRFLPGGRRDDAEVPLQWWFSRDETEKCV
ncbi:uncharacterized protein [Patagioenas fasciata]|uniref:uncharacterized protein n=1 Tax=Patagioenas fasciata TaxID=372321 RepID=UPI003A99EF4A